MKPLLARQSHSPLFALLLLLLLIVTYVHDALYDATPTGNDAFPTMPPIDSGALSAPMGDTEYSTGLCCVPPGALAKHAKTSCETSAARVSAPWLLALGVSEQGVVIISV